MSTRTRFAALFLLGGALAGVLGGCGDHPDMDGPAALLAPDASELPVEPVSGNTHALSFARGGRIEIPYSPVYKNPEFTVELWVNPKALRWGFTPLIASSYTNEWNTADGFSLKFESDRVYLRAAKASNLAQGYYAPYEPPAGRWTHLAGTYDGAVARVYVNGELRVETKDERPVWYGTRGLFIGAGEHSLFGGYSYFTGVMDEIRIWSHARSADEIRSTMQTELAGEESGLVGYWNFEKQDGVVVRDGSPYGTHGSINGFVHYVGSTPF